MTSKCPLSDEKTFQRGSLGAAPSLWSRPSSSVSGRQISVAAPASRDWDSGGSSVWSEITPGGRQRCEDGVGGSGAAGTALQPDGDPSVSRRQTRRPVSNLNARCVDASAAAQHKTCPA